MVLRRYGVTEVREVRGQTFVFLGNAARYIYDEVGNIIEIRRTNVGDFTGPVAITFFDPDRGEVGTEVTI